MDDQAAKPVDAIGGAEHEIVELAEGLLAVADRVASEGHPAAASLRGHLDELGASLRAHYAVEEEPDGLYATLDRGLPHRAARIAELLEEHERILERLDCLSRRASAPLPSWDDDRVVAEARYLASFIRRHESHEIELVYELALGDEAYGSGE